MALPWFAFNINSYITDTMRLTTEGHGAYLLLMLDYYATETPPPDDDAVLASITKLPLDRWQAIRPTLARFFVVGSGFWKHERIEAEMLEASSKHAQRIAQARHAADIKYGRTPKQDAPSIPPARPRKEKPPKTARSMPAASPEQSSENPHKQTHSLITEREQDPLKGEMVNLGSLLLGTLVPVDYEPSTDVLMACVADGATSEEVGFELRKFILHHTENGTHSKDWDASWERWWIQWKQHKAKQAKAAPPRVEVDVTPPPRDWDKAAGMFAKIGVWMKNHGNAPGSPSCECPADILLKHGIDPITGRKMETAK